LGIKPTAQVHKHPGGGVPISPIPIPLLRSRSNGPRVFLIVLVRRAQSPHQPSNSSTPLRPSQLTCSYESRVDVWGARPQRGRGGSTKPSFRRGGGCSWWGVVFVLGVDVGVVVGWCVVAFVGGCVVGPHPHSNPHPTSTRTFHIHITHYPHTHPKLRVSAGLVDPRGSTSTSKDPPPKNPHHPQSTSKPGRRTGGAGGSTTWIHHPIHSKSTGQGDGHQPIPPPPPTKATPRGRKIVLQVVTRCCDARPSWVVVLGGG